MKQKHTIKRKIFLVTIVFLVLSVILVKSTVETVLQIYEKEKEKEEFTVMLEELEEKEEELNDTVTKLQDPDYVARFAREKYLYSKDGEIIIRIPD